MKYLQLYASDSEDAGAAPDWRNHLSGKTGFRVLVNAPFNWIKSFKLVGEAHMAWVAGLPEVELDNHETLNINDADNIIHVHLCGEHFSLIHQVKTAAPKAKILASVDYGLNLWGRALGFHTIDAVVDALRPADWVFSTEPEIAWLLTDKLGRDVPCIPHPYNIADTARFKASYEEPKVCVIMVHNYDNDYYYPHLVLHDLPVRTHVVGIKPEDTSLVKGILYNRVTPYSTFEFMLSSGVNNLTLGQKGGFLPKAYMAFDSYGLKVSGRFQCDCAALGLPCVGSDLAMFQKILFPETTGGYYSVEDQRFLAKRLLTEPEFYDGVSDKCQERLKPFDLKPTVERMMSFIEGKGFKDYKEIR